MKYGLLLADFAHFRSVLKDVEAALNNSQFPIEERVSRALAFLPKPILNDVEGSADYRLFVVKNLLFDVFAALIPGGMA